MSISVTKMKKEKTPLQRQVKKAKKERKANGVASSKRIAKIQEAELGFGKASQTGQPRYNMNLRGYAPAIEAGLKNLAGFGLHPPTAPAPYYEGSSAVVATCGLRATTDTIPAQAASYSAYVLQGLSPNIAYYVTTGATWLLPDTVNNDPAVLYLNGLGEQWGILDEPLNDLHYLSHYDSRFGNGWLFPSVPAAVMRFTSSSEVRVSLYNNTSGVLIMSNEFNGLWSYTPAGTPNIFMKVECLTDGTGKFLSISQTGTTVTVQGVPEVLEAIPWVDYQSVAARTDKIRVNCAALVMTNTTSELLINGSITMGRVNSAHPPQAEYRNFLFTTIPTRKSKLKDGGFAGLVADFTAGFKSPNDPIYLSPFNSTNYFNLIYVSGTVPAGTSELQMQIKATCWMDYLTNDTTLTRFMLVSYGSEWLIPASLFSNSLFFTDNPGHEKAIRALKQLVTLVHKHAPSKEQVIAFAKQLGQGAVTALPILLGAAL